jgi:hypothetical protein
MLTPSASPVSPADEIRKASALSGIAQAVAATDPDRAERIAQALVASSP